MAWIDYSTRPHCPYPCAGSFCPYTESDPECHACEARLLLDAHHRAMDAWWETQMARTAAGQAHG